MRAAQAGREKLHIKGERRLKIIPTLIYRQKSALLHTLARLEYPVGFLLGTIHATILWTKDDVLYCIVQYECIIPKSSEHLSLSSKQYKRPPSAPPHDPCTLFFFLYRISISIMSMSLSRKRVGKSEREGQKKKIEQEKDPCALYSFLDLPHSLPIYLLFHPNNPVYMSI